MSQGHGATTTPVPRRRCKGLNSHPFVDDQVKEDNEACRDIEEWEKNGRQ